MSKISLYDSIKCDGVIDMLHLSPTWTWHRRPFPFFRRGSMHVRDLYCFSVLSLSGIREIVRWYESHLDEIKSPWWHFKHFIVALSNEGVGDESIMSILTEVAGYLEKEKTKKLMDGDGGFMLCDI